MANKQLSIKTRPCVVPIIDYTNIKWNMSNIENWVQPCLAHNREVAIIGAGPSLKKYIPQLKQMKKDNPNLFTLSVKHALPKLLEEGITPEGCIILDPRSLAGESTHGVSRKSLYSNLPKETTYFVATTTDFNTTKLLQEQGVHIIGWHCWVPTMEACFPHVEPKVYHGSCAFMRGISLFRLLGFNTFHLFGGDSSLGYTPTQEQIDLSPPRRKIMRTKYKMADGSLQPFYTTGELLAQAQELEHLFNSSLNTVRITMNCDGLGQAIYQCAVATQKLADFGNIELAH